MIVIPTCVYRFYDAEDHLLYVGVTNSPGVRFLDHMRRDWWGLAVRNTFSWHDSRDAALAEEARAIYAEAPLHNVAGTAPPPMPRRAEDIAERPVYEPRAGSPRKRRPRGTGGLFFRESTGYWVGRVYTGYGERGQRVAREVASRDRDRCDRKLEDLKRELGVTS